MPNTTEAEVLLDLPGRQWTGVAAVPYAHTCFLRQKRYATFIRLFAGLFGGTI